MNQRNFLVFALILLLSAGGFSLASFETKESPKKRAVPVRTVTDGYGKSITIPQHPKRVVILSASQLEMYIEAGGREALVGRTESRAFSEDFLKSIEGIEVLGFPSGVSPEKIISLKPDLVIGVENTFQRQLEPLFTQAGIPLLLQSSDNIEQNIDTIRLFGELTGKPENANQMIQKIETAKIIAQKRSEGKKPARVLLIWGTTKSFSMILPDTLQNDLLILAQGENIVSKKQFPEEQIKGLSYIPLSLEFAIAEKPDYILFLNHGDPELIKKALEKDMRENSAWSSIPAVKQGKIEVLPFDLFGINPGVRSDQAILYLNQLLYPEK